MCVCVVPLISLLSTQRRFRHILARTSSPRCCSACSATSVHAISMNRLERTENQTRWITGLLGCGCSLQHGKITLPLIVLFLLVSPAISTVGAQTGTNGTATEPYPYTKFTPSMAIIIVVLLGALFVMGFFSIYIRHCSEGDGASVRNTLAGLSASMRSRRGGAASRGLDAAVIETFPTFAYSVVKGLKVGKGALECAVCLNEFEDDETLRLIPKCDHVFHPHCIDAWLASHVTCPVCRADLVPQPGDTVEVAAEHADVAEEIENPQTDEVSIQIGDDHDETTVQQHPPQVMDRNVSSKWSRNRQPRSRSVRSVLFGKFPRSHSTGHSLVNPGENTDRFTLRLPDEIRKQVMSRALNRTKSCVVVFPTEGSSRGGHRTGGQQEGSSRGRFYRRLDREAKSDRWVFSIVPPFLSREPSVKSPKVVAGDGEGASVTTPRSLVTAVKTQFNCLEPKADETKLVSADSVRPPV